MRNRYKLVAFLVSIFFLVFLPHNNLVNQFDSVFTQKPVLSVTKPSSDGQVESAINHNYNGEKNTLLTKLKSDLSDSRSFSVTIYDINGNEFFGLNETQQFQAASVMKTLVATTTFRQIEAGKFTLDKSLGDGSVQDQLQQMINQSNNNSWDLLNNLVGLPTEQSTADALGLPGVKITQNQMSTLAVTKLLLQLYKGEDITLEHRDLLFSWMQNTDTEDRITASIPDHVTAYHKTGTYGGGVHDAAVVIHPREPFIVTIFTDDDSGQVDQPALIRQTTKDIYDYFDSL